MFQNLRQGNTVYILEQNNHLTLKQGKIVKIEPNYTGSLDIKVKADDQEYELKQLPYNQIIANNGSLIISENLDSILNEVRKLKTDSEDKINNHDYYIQTAQDCDEILKKYDKSYAKEQQRQEEIDNLKQQNKDLKNQISAMAQSLSNIEKLLSVKN